MTHFRVNIHPRVALLIGLAFALLCACLKGNTASPFNGPESFFTDVADRLLQQQLGTRTAKIQIAPTNQYDSAVHRIFQVAANIYDATSTNEFPTVFRPLFTTNGTGVFLGGFTNDDAAATLNAWIASNPYGIPMVIAARKGFPNFNEFTMRSDITVQRKLQVTRPNSAHGTRPDGTNQMYVVGVSNYFGVESWNSYQRRYPRPVTLSVSNATTFVISNELGIQTNVFLAESTETNVSELMWQGFVNFQPGTQSFLLPFSTNEIFLSSAAFRFSDNSFGSDTNTFEVQPGFPLPYWMVGLSNHLTYAIKDGDHVVDFVFLNSTEAIDLHRDLLTVPNPYGGLAGVPSSVTHLWNTNRVGDAGAPTDGIIWQMDINLGNTPEPVSTWREFGLNFLATENDKNRAVDAFRSFCGLTPLTTNAVATNASLAMMAPFNPALKLSVMSTWQANDPLVHYMIADLENARTNQQYQYLRPAQPGTNTAPSSLGYLNTFYSPWGGNPFRSDGEPSDFDQSLKDPGVYSSDYWNFPSNETFTVRSLGRIHRGTPWQTIYLKADTAPLDTWLQYAADSRTHPTNDWRMVELLAALLSTNDVRALASINTTNLNKWAATFMGLTVLSNTTEHPIRYQPVRFDTNVIVTGTPQIGVLLNGINRVRVQQRGQYFSSLAGFLSVPELSSASPWLNLGDLEIVNWGLTDEAYEILPAQLLSLVRPDPVVSVEHTSHTIQLRVNAFDGYAYRVERSADLSTWTTLSEPHYATNEEFTLVVPADCVSQFFRVLMLP